MTPAHGKRCPAVGLSEPRLGSLGREYGWGRLGKEIKCMPAQAGGHEVHDPPPKSAITASRNSWMPFLRKST